MTTLFFEIMSALPRQGPGDVTCTRRALEAVPNVGPQTRLLDIGCGNGNFLRYLAVIQPAKLQPGAEGTILDSLPVSTDYNVILSPCKLGSLPSALWHSSYVIYM